MDGITGEHDPRTPSKWPKMVFIDTDILRIEVEDSGYIGFVEYLESDSLVDIRRKIHNAVENAPESFIFLTNDCLPIGVKQESRLLAANFGGRICLRPISDAAPPALRMLQFMHKCSCA